MNNNINKLIYIGAIIINLFFWNCGGISNKNMDKGKFKALLKNNKTRFGSKIEVDSKDCTFIKYQNGILSYNDNNNNRKTVDVNDIDAKIEEGKIIIKDIRRNSVNVAQDVKKISNNEIKINKTWTCNKCSYDKNKYHESKCKICDQSRNCNYKSVETKNISFKNKKNNNSFGKSIKEGVDEKDEFENENEEEWADVKLDSEAPIISSPSVNENKYIKQIHQEIYENDNSSISDLKSDQEEIPQLNFDLYSEYIQVMNELKRPLGFLMKELPLELFYGTNFFDEISEQNQNYNETIDDFLTWFQKDGDLSYLGLSSILKTYKNLNEKILYFLLIIKNQKEIETWQVALGGGIFIVSGNTDTSDYISEIIENEYKEVHNLNQKNRIIFLNKLHQNISQKRKTQDIDHIIKNNAECKNIICKIAESQHITQKFRNFINTACNYNYIEEYYNSNLSFIEAFGRQSSKTNIPKEICKIVLSYRALSQNSIVEFQAYFNYYLLEDILTLVYDKDPRDLIKSDTTCNEVERHYINSQYYKFINFKRAFVNLNFKTLFFVCFDEKVDLSNFNINILIAAYKLLLNPQVRSIYEDYIGSSRFLKRTLNFFKTEQK